VAGATIIVGIGPTVRLPGVRPPIIGLLA
jgi:hypothetical protein